eukprot:GHVP01067647.1.p2 GENE.GHVP01067647.1~~GHVP01067647.1.p2  ORF type:complete len:311 (-),score=40.72 GHVP01067647.1:170-1102(-)
MNNRDLIPDRTTLAILAWLLRAGTDTNLTEGADTDTLEAGTDTKVANKADGAKPTCATPNVTDFPAFVRLQMNVITSDRTNLTEGKDPNILEAGTDTKITNKADGSLVAFHNTKLPILTQILQVDNRYTQTGTGLTTRVTPNVKNLITRVRLQTNNRDLITPHRTNFAILARATPNVTDFPAFVRLQMNVITSDRTNLTEGKDPNILEAGTDTKITNKADGAEPTCVIPNVTDFPAFARLQMNLITPDRTDFATPARLLRAGTDTNLTEGTDMKILAAGTTDGTEPSEAAEGNEREPPRSLHLKLSEFFF